MTLQVSMASAFLFLFSLTISSSTPLVPKMKDMMDPKMKNMMDPKMKDMMDPKMKDVQTDNGRFHFLAQVTCQDSCRLSRPLQTVAVCPDNFSQLQIIALMYFLVCLFI